MSADDDRFDGLYLNVANSTRGIEPLLDTVFSFLRRKTDFFAGPPGTGSEEGVEIAIKKVNDVLEKHASLYREGLTKKKSKSEKPVKKVEKEPPRIELLDDDNDEPVSNDTTSPTVKEVKETNDDEKTKEAEGGSSEDKETPPPIGNGGIVPGKFVWTQTLPEVTMNFPLPDNTRGRDLNVVIAKKHLKFGLKKDAGSWIVNAPLVKPIICDDSFWTVEDGNRLVINLQKLNQMEWWPSVCVGDPTIDVKTIQPENSRLGDLDGETRQTVEKMMFDQRQKALGLPTSDEQQKWDMLEKFKKAHPEMDFSNAKMS